LIWDQEAKMEDSRGTPEEIAKTKKSITEHTKAVL
jgi:hypothetical protein